MKLDVKELIKKELQSTLVAKDFTATFNAVANSLIDLGLLSDLLPSGWSPLTMMPVVPSGVNTNVFGNSVDWLIYEGHLYVKTYMTLSNVSLQFYCLCIML